MPMVQTYLLGVNNQVLGFKVKFYGDLLPNYLLFMIVSPSTFIIAF